MNTIRIFGAYLIMLIGNLAHSQEGIRHQYDSIIASSAPDEVKVIKVEALFRQKFTDTLEQAQMYHDFAKWNWRNVEDKNKAITLGKRGNELLIKVDSTDLYLVHKNLYNLGFFNYKLDFPDYSNALYYLDTLITISESKSRILGKAFKLKADVYEELGDFQQAIENYKAAERIYIRNKDYNLLFTMYNNIMVTYANLREANYVLDFFNIQIKIEELLKLYKVEEEDLIELIMNEGIMLDTAEKFEEAFKVYDKALKLAKKYKDSSNIFKLYNNLGVLYKRQGMFNQAREYHLKSIPYINKSNYNKSLLENNLGELLIAEGNYKEGLRQFEKALTTRMGKNYDPLVPLPTLQEIEVSPFKREIAGFLIDRLKALLIWNEHQPQKVRIEEAQKTIELADAVVDLLYFESREDLSKLFWRKKGATLYQQAVALCYQQGDFEGAFYYMEKSKGLLLLENITTVKARKNASIPEELTNREYELQSKLKALEEQVQQESLTTRDSLLQSVFHQKQEYRRFIDSLEISYPAYYRFKRALKMVTLKDVQKNMQHNETLLEYIVGLEKGYILEITTTEITMHEFDINSAFQSDIDQLQQYLKRPLNTYEDVQAYKTIAHRIFKQIMPFYTLTEDSVQKLTIIPDGLLQYIPFEALIVDKDQELSQAYLIANNDIHYQYSLSVSEETMNLEVTQNSGYSAYVLSEFQDTYLPTLSRGDEEIAQLKTFFSNPKTQKTATKNSFLQSYDAHNVIHVSTHGGIKQGTPWLGFYDETLTLDELYFLRNSKELVVLSACQTSQGNYQMGEGVFSLTRGFLNSGAQSVVSTLWDLNEKSGQEITIKFYKYLKNRQRRSEALRNAKLDYLKEHQNTKAASPYYWSGIILTGNNDVISPEYYLNTFWIIGVVFILLLLVLLFFIYKKIKTPTKNEAEY